MVAIATGQFDGCCTQKGTLGRLRGALFQRTRQTSFFPGTIVGVQNAALDSLVNFAVGQSHSFLHHRHLFRGGIGSILASCFKILLHQRFDSRFVGLVAETIAFRDLNAFDC